MSFPAKYGGICAECDEPFAEDDLIARSGSGWGHEECPGLLPDVPPEGCTNCFMVKPCMCGHFGEEY